MSNTVRQFEVVAAFAPAASAPARSAAYCQPSPPAPRFTSRVSRLTQPPSAFTLVELLLVMAVLIMVISLAAPSLAGFFRGRSLDSEARRLMALAHAGQSRAVSEGVPMLLWVDVDQGKYGLEEEPGWVEKDPKAEQFTLDKDLKLAVVNVTVAKPAASSRNRVPASLLARANTRNLPEIRFLPDGSFDESSVRALRVTDRENTSLWLAQSANRLNYEIRNQFE